EGDRAENVFTLPVIFGDKIGKIIIGILSALSILLTPVIYPGVPIFVFLFFFFLAAAIFFAINRSNFKEWIAILVYVIYALMIVLFIERPLWLLI
ncbi:MAG: hypothetical protein WCL13_04265, partial [bacterium]